MASVQGTLALDYGHARPHRTRRPSYASCPAGAPSSRRSPTGSPRAVVEVVGGDRGPSQLLRWTSDGVYADLQRRTALLAGTTPGDRRVRRLRSQVRSVHLFCPSPEAAEISVHVRHGERSRAIAARIELVDGAGAAPPSSSAEDPAASRWSRCRPHPGWGTDSE